MRSMAVGGRISCDPETGEVTVIIDWERCTTAPRCIGYASLPIFLTVDWFPDYSHCSATRAPWSLGSYRLIYWDVMIAATGAEGDGKYAAKSALYQVAYTALYCSAADGSILHFVQQVLDTLGLHFVDQDDFVDWSGDDIAVKENSCEFDCRRYLLRMLTTIGKYHSHLGLKDAFRSDQARSSSRRNWVEAAHEASNYGSRVTSCLRLSAGLLMLALTLCN
jgi:hypothetical protein